MTSLSFESHAMSLIGRLGMGMSNQMVNETPAISMKVQRNRSTAFGALLALDSSSEETTYATGLKLYRIIYDEPQLNFYLSVLGGMYNYDYEGELKNGYQVDGTFGTEMHLQGLESVGFSFEFGMSMHNYNNERHFQTVGYNILQAAVHFYL